MKQEPMPRPEIGGGIVPRALARAGAYVLATMEEPLALIGGDPPGAVRVVLNRDMSLESLERLAEQRPAAGRVVGLGGGAACDTAKFLAWRWGLPLTLAPSVISVDAFLCRSIAVRVQGRVRYIGDVSPERILVDTDLIRRAPPQLNRAGVADVVSIASALGDWLLARDAYGERFDQAVFDRAHAIVRELMRHEDAIRDVTPEGIAALVQGLYDQAELCRAWGDARPEEGSEHFLAYCLEDITREHYIHGQLIALNVLVALRLQRDRAVFPVSELKAFFDGIRLRYAPAHQGIAPADFRQALATAGGYVRRENLFKSLWWRDDVFDAAGRHSLDGIVDWAYALP